VPALSPYLIELIWEQFRALLPEYETDHPLGCHRPRIPERIVFEKLVQILVFGCAYERITDGRFDCAITLDNLLGKRRFKTTVGAHLYRVFPKLGVTSRGQIRDALDSALA
jgi:hypothetical protein